jgi:hypothetical protein
VTEVDLHEHVRGTRWGSLPIDETRALQKRVLEEFVRCGALGPACLAASVTYYGHFYWLRNDEDYYAAFAEARELVSDKMEAEAYRRAVDGIDRVVYSQGKVVGSQREYSDNLLTLLLKANRPEKYKDRVSVTEESVDAEIARLREENARRQQAIDAHLIHEPAALTA